MASPVQARGGFGARLLVAERRVVGPCVLKVRCDLDARNRQEADARVVDRTGQELGQVLSNLLANPDRTLGRHPEMLNALNRRLDLLDRERLDDIADLEIVELFESNAALEP